MEAIIGLLMFFGVFAACWYGVVALIAMAGWKKAAAAYRMPAGLSSTRLGIVGGSIHSATYKNAIILRACPEGLVLKISLLFRINHPPLLIPWREVRVTEAGANSVFSPAYAFCGADEKIRLTLKRRAYNRLKNELLRYASGT